VTTWQPIETAPDRQTVRTKIDDGNGVRNEAYLKRNGRLWFFPDGSMYVYYTPTHWAPLPVGVDPENAAVKAPTSTPEANAK